MVEVVASSLLMLVAIGTIIALLTHVLAPRRHGIPRIVSRGAIMWFSIDH
jgi:hypothetical protein